MSFVSQPLLQMGRLSLYLLSRLFFRVRIIGAHNLPETGAALLVSNHVSFADAVLIGSCTRRTIHFLMWQPYFDFTFGKPFLKILGVIPLATKSPKKTLQSLLVASQQLRKGKLVGIFPEGSLSRTGHVHAFQRGIEHLLKKSPDVPVIPVYIDGLIGHPLSATGNRSPRKWIRERRRDVTVLIGVPIREHLTAHQLRTCVLALGTKAVDMRRRSDSTLVHVFVRNARKHWFRPALADSTKKQLSFGRTLIVAILMRNWLRTNHSGEGHIAVLLPASVGAAITNLGVALAGKVVVNLNFTAGEQSYREAMRQCGIRTVITSKPFLAKASLPTCAEMTYLEDVMPHFGRKEKLWALLAAIFSPPSELADGVLPDTIATVLFSSGSTGVPKGVELTHWNILSNIEAAASVFPLHSHDCMLGVLPFFHSFGFTFALWFPIVKHIQAVFHMNPTDSKVIGELARQHKATFFLSTPTFCNQYLKKCTPEQFSSLRYILVGAEKLRDDLAKDFEQKFGVGLLAGYGATELGPCAAVNTPNALDSNLTIGSRAGSVGRPLPGVTVRIVQPETFEPVQEGESGLILINSPSRMVGYLGDLVRTASALHEGFYITGDIGYLDADGFLFIVDRLSRFSKVAGEMVPHVKIEETARELFTDADCFLTGVADERRGERLVLLYTSPELSPEEIVNGLSKAGLPALWTPKRENIYLVDSIPVLGTGKVDLGKARSLAYDKVLGKEAAATGLR